MHNYRLLTHFQTALSIRLACLNTGLTLQAFKKQIFLPRHVLLTNAWYKPTWWRFKSNHNCTVEQMEMTLNGSIAFLQFNLINRFGTDDVITTDGLVRISLRADKLVHELVFLEFS